MGPDGFIELELGPVDGEISKQPEEVLGSSSDGVDETNSRLREFEEVQNSEQNHLNVITPQSDVFCVEQEDNDTPDVFPRRKPKKDNGLRSKRGGKALKIHVISPGEESQRRRSHFVASMAGNAPLYPLDLQEHGVDSSQEDESDRSSSFSAEVAANGFGSPIELLSGDGFEELPRTYDEKRLQGIVQIELDEIPLSTKFDSANPATVVKREGNDDEDLQEGTAAGREATGNFLTIYVLKTLVLITVWYILSTCLTVYNKILLGKDDNHFPAPLLMNTIHFSMQGVISTILIRCKPSLRPTVHMSWKDYFMRVVPTAIATALDIDLTNVSLVFVTVTFVTMFKSGSPIFILLFAFLFKLEVPSYKLLGIILIISAGVMLTVTKATDFNVPGFILVISATVMSGFRWTVTQLLLQKEEYGLNNPFAAMSVLTPVMAVISLVLSLILEPWKTLQSPYFDTSLHVLSSCALMLLGGTIAFFMVSTEYVLLSKTSAVTLTVAGVVKEVVTIVVAVLYLRERFTLLKGLGLLIIILGVSLYNLYKYQKLKDREAGGHDVLDNLNGNHHKYVALKESKAVFELGDEIDEDVL